MYTNQCTLLFSPSLHLFWKPGCLISCASPTPCVLLDAARWGAVGRPDNGIREGGQEQNASVWQTQTGCYCITQAFGLLTPGCCSQGGRLSSFTSLFSASSFPAEVETERSSGARLLHRPLAEDLHMSARWGTVCFPALIRLRFEDGRRRKVVWKGKTATRTSSSTSERAKNQMK